MKLTEYKGTIEELMTSGSRSNLFRLLSEFADSEMICVEVEGFEDHYASASSCQASLYQAIKHYGFAMKTFAKNKKVYIVKEVHKK